MTAATPTPPATPMGAPGDAAARARIAADLDTTLFVEAAAGTGKTTALVSRIVAALRAGRATLDRVVAVTFTEKAAGEMKLRLRAEIERERADAEAPEEVRRRFEEALAQLEIARLGTIHAFCADLLRERPVEAGVDPLFEVAPEDEAEALLDRAFDDWLQRALADPPEGVRRVLRRRARGPDAQSPRLALRAAASALVRHRDHLAPWRRDPFDRAAAIDHVLAALADLAPLAAESDRADDYLLRNLREVRRFVEDNAHQERVRARDYDALEAGLRELARRREWRWRGSGRFGRRDRATVLAQRDAAKAALDRLTADADADLAACLHGELRPVVEAYEALLRREGKLDFLDLLLKARDLVRGDGAVRAELQERFSHFFVDEFQDTDPLQAEILLLLAAADSGETDFRRARPRPGKLFLVGDPKQSIYRFRRADVSLYEAVKRQLVGSGAEVLQLATSFRGVPELQAAVNAAFAPVMRGAEDGSQAEYVPLQPHRPAVADPARPALVALPVPRPYSTWGRVTRWAIEESLPDAVGAFVDWLVARSGWTVTERDRPEVPVPVAPRHVCILFRRFKGFREDTTRPYVRALEARRLPHVLVGGRSFHDREEVLALRNALVAIEWPDDLLRVFATLRGPLFALGDDALLAFRSQVGALHPLRRLREEERAALGPPEREVAEALAILGRLHAGRNRRPIAATVLRLLDAVRAHAGIANWSTGEQALANCLRLLDRARRFERRGAPSFRAFVERLEDEAERGEGEEAPIVEEGTEGVRIMTVHKAKGLEFPVVVLADLTCRATRLPPSHHADPARRLWVEPLCGAAPRELLERLELEAGRDQAEALRVAYVAATRARDLLVVPAVGDEEVEGWLDVLNPALYPREAERKRPRPAPGCPPFGGDSVLKDARPPDARPKLGPVAPGLHTAKAGNPVVWWDPKALELDRDEAIGLRQFRLLEADAAGVVAEEGREAHRRWQEARADERRRGAEPALRLRTATALAAEGAVAVDAAEFAVDVVRLIDGAVAARRPAGTRFGALVHAAFAAADLGTPAAVAPAVAAQARLLGSSAEEIEAATAAVAAALAHPLLRRAAASPERRRETPLLLRLPGGELLEGVVDLAFREVEDGRPIWTVLDFKTDRELEPRRDVYERQVRLYCQALAAATGEPTRGVLLVV